MPIHLIWLSLGLRRQAINNHDIYWQCIFFRRDSYLFCCDTVNAMAANDMAPSFVRPSAIMVLATDVPYFFRRGSCIFCSSIVNTMVADGLAPGVARPSPAMVLTVF